MKAFWKIVIREIRQIKRSPLLLFAIFLLPVICCVVLSTTFSAGTATKLPIAVIDSDNGELSRNIVRAVNSVPSCEVKYRPTDLNEAKKLLSTKKIYAVLYIPKDFGRDINRLSAPKLTYWYNNQTILIGGVVTKDVQSAVMTASSLVNASILMKQGIPKDALSSKVNVIKVEEHVKANPYINYSYFLLYAAFAHVFQMMTMLTSIWTLGSEFKNGTTKRWLKAADGSILTAVFGKFFVYGILFYLSMISCYAAYTLIFGASFEGSVATFLTCGALFIFACEALGVMYVAILSNLRFSLSCAAFYTASGFTLAGMTYPIAAMPAIMRYYSALYPIRPFVNLTIDQIMRGFAPIYDVKNFVWLAALALVGLAFMPLLKKHAENKDLWYGI